MTRDEIEKAKEEARFLLLQTPPSARTDPQALRRAVFLDRAFFL